MKKNYECPDLEYISLIADEAIANSLLEGSADLESSFEDGWAE